MQLSKALQSLQLKLKPLGDGASERRKLFLMTGFQTDPDEQIN
jgi:hypothetical protein